MLQCNPKIRDTMLKLKIQCYIATLKLEIQCYIATLKLEIQCYIATLKLEMYNVTLLPLN